MPIAADRVDGPQGDEKAEAASQTTSSATTRDATWDVLSEHIKDLIILSDLGGTIFYASPSCRSFGYAQHELVGRKATDFLHLEDVTPGAADLPAAVRSEVSRRERRRRWTAR